MFIGYFFSRTNYFDLLTCFSRWGVIGWLPALSHTVSVLRVQPLDYGSREITDDGGELVGRPLAAIGTHSGVVHLVDLSGGCEIYKDLQIHACPIK
jgi:hypothetical protein